MKITGWRCQLETLESNREWVSYPREECVEAVDLLPLGDVSVELRNALQSQLLHQVDLIGLLKVFGLPQ